MGTLYKTLVRARRLRVHNLPLTARGTGILGCMTPSRVRLIYTILGTAFAVLGALALLNVASAMRVGGVLLWGALAYSLMDLLVAYGLFNRERWVPHVFLLNLIGLAVLFGADLFFRDSGAVDLPFYALSLGINALLAAFLYKTSGGRGKIELLQDKAGMAFVLLWAIMFCYTVAGNFS